MARLAVCLNGSPRPQGTTALLVSRIVEGLESEGVRVKTHLVGALDIRGCRGCWACRDSGVCPQPDDMPMLVRDVPNSDIIVMASPSYWGDVTAQLKAFIDRSLPLHHAYVSGAMPHGKLGISIAVRAGSAPEESQHLIGTIEHYYGHLGISPAGSLAVEGVHGPLDLDRDPAKLRAAFDLGAEIARQAALS